MASEPHSWSDVADRRTTTDGIADQLLLWANWIWRTLEFSAAYLALIAVAEVLIVELLLALPLSPAPIVVGLITFAVYANDRLVDLDSDGASNPYRTAFVRQYRRALYLLAAVAYGLAVALSALGGPMAFALALLPGAAWGVYALDWAPPLDVGFQRLKELFLVNSLLVALAWSVTVVFLPLAFADASLTPVSAVVFVYFALATFVNTEIANVYDVASDLKSGVVTMPVALGVRRTQHALGGVTLLTAGILGYAALAGYLSLVATATLSIGLCCLLAVIALLDRVDSDRLLPLAAECTRLPVFAILAASALWV